MRTDPIDKRPSGKRRSLGRRVWRVLEWSLLGLVGLVVLLLLSLQTTVVRYVVAKQVNGVLRSTFAGRVTIERVDRLGLTGVGGATIRVQDEAGTQLLLVDHASVDIATWATLRSVLKRDGDIVIDITRVTLPYVDADLDADKEGNLKLLQAFAPKEPKSDAAPSSRATVVHLRKVDLTHGWVHGEPQAGSIVDTELDSADLSLIVGGDRTIADLATLDVNARALPGGTTLRTHLEAHYAKLSPDGKDTGRVELRGETSGAAIASSFLGRASTDGLAVAADFHVESGTGRLDIDAQGTIANEKKLHAKIIAFGLDARAFAKTAPPTKLGVDVTIDVALDANGNGKGSYVIDVPPGEAAGNLVPAARIEGEMTLGQARGETQIAVTGRGNVEEPGANVAVRFEMAKNDALSTLDVTLRSVAPHLEQTRLGRTIAGSAAVDVAARVAMAATTTVSATVDLRASNVASGDARVQNARLRINARGTLEDPDLAVTLDAAQIAAGGMRFKRASLGTRGSLHAVDVTGSVQPEDGPRVDLQGLLAVGSGASVQNARITVARDDVTAILRIAKAQIVGSNLRAEGLSLEGLGEPVLVELSKTDRALTVRATSAGVDLGKVGRLLRAKDLQGGTATLDVDMTVRKTGATGHARAELTDGAFARVKNAKAHVDARFAGRSGEAEMTADLGAIGHLAIRDTHIELDPKRPVNMAALDEAQGKLNLDADLDLGRIRALLPRGTLPFTDMQGRLSVKGDITRESSREVPDMHLSLVTRGLALSGRGEEESVDGTRVFDTPPWSFEGVDVELAASVAKEDGATAVKARLLDRAGTLVGLDANSPALPLRQWLRTKTVDPKQLGALRFTAAVDVPRRELKKLPAVLKTRQMGGAVGAKVTFDGSLADPDVHLEFQADQWSAPATRGMQPINAKVDARYGKAQGKADITVSSSNKELFAGTVEMQGRPPGLPGAPGGSETPWTASSRVHIADFPLETFNTFSDFQLEGRVNGDVTVDGLHEDARAKIALTLQDLKLGKVRFPRGQANVDFDGRSLRGALRLDQTDGFLQAEGALGMRWGKEAGPSIAPDDPGYASFKASGLRAAAALPFAKSVFSSLDGRIDADGRIDLTPGQDAPKMQGKAVLDRGFAQLNRLGEPLHGIRLRVALSPDGAIKLDELTAQGTTGKVQAKGDAKLNGMQLANARLNITIPKNDPFPVDIDGQAVGDVDADINVTAAATPDQRALNVKVDIPRLHVQLPVEPKNKPQELGEADKIRVGYFRRPHQFVILPKDAEDLEKGDDEASEKPQTTTTVAVHLGDDVEIKRGVMLRIALTGNPKAEITDKARMSGQIRLTRGMLEVQGRRFKIEKGTVTFVGDDPGNPQIIVTAGWDAPDGTRVYADFVGPLKTGQVRLRSEPSRPQNEIVALIMFGTAEGSSATPYPTQQPDGTTRAGAVAGGFAAEGLNKGLNQLTGLDVATKIDTSKGNPRPEIEIQIARDIAIQVAYVLGTPSPGTNPDRTYVTLDWRFRRNWSMETTFGDQGSSIVDFLWQYRY
jgi:translocation and assembly module TamB